MEPVRDRSPIREMEHSSDLFHIEDPNIPSQLKFMFKKSSCDLCRKNFESDNSAYQHYHGRIHSRAAQIWTLKNKHEEIPLFCDVCSVSFSSPIPASSHYDGKKHKSAVIKSKLKKAIEDVDGERRFGIGEGFKPPENEQTIPVLFRCDLCLITCPNNSALQDHYDGAKHKKKLINMETQNGENDSTKKNQLMLMERIAQVNLNCCDTTFPDIVSLVEHLRSSSHFHISKLF